MAQPTTHLPSKWLFTRYAKLPWIRSKATWTVHKGAYLGQHLGSIVFRSDDKIWVSSLLQAIGGALQECNSHDSSGSFWCFGVLQKSSKTQQGRTPCFHCYRDNAGVIWHDLPEAQSIWQSAYSREKFWEYVQQVLEPGKAPKLCG